MRVFFQVDVKKNNFFSQFGKKNVWTEKNALNVRGFFRRGNLERSSTIFFASIFSEKRVLLRAFKILRGFSARAFQIFVDKKASKTVIFQIEKSEEKKNLWQIHLLKCLENTRKYCLEKFQKYLWNFWLLFKSRDLRHLHVSGELNIKILPIKYVSCCIIYVAKGERAKGIVQCM